MKSSTLPPRSLVLIRAARATALSLLASAASYGATWFVSPTGSDSNSGTLSAPFATISHAQSSASSGDTVYLRGGTYTAFSVVSSDSNYNYAVTLTKSGITYAGYPGDSRPVLDFSGFSAASHRVCALLVTGSNNTFQDFDVTGVQVGSQKQSECWRVDAGSGNVFRRLRMHDGAGVGIYIVKTASNTLVENCDSYNLIGVSGTSAGNIDGFGCHSSGSGNMFRFCRSWHNSDDGYDCINAAGAITFDHCWSYNNGVNGGDGNGFKVGGWGCSGGAFPNPPPVHRVQFCLAASNHSHGFYANHQPGQSANWYNNTSYNNGAGDFDMLEGVDSTNCSISGYREVLHNNIAFVGTLVADDADPSGQETFNSWTLSHTPASSDFQGTDATQITTPRNSDGTLPTIAFMHLASGSYYIDRGTNVGLAYNGSAPDLGCFETGTSATYYKLQNRATGLYVDGMGLTTNGSDCGQWSGSTSLNQQWSIVAAGSYVRLQNRATGLFIDGAGRTTNGSTAAQWSDSTSTNQQWLEVAAGSYTRFQNRATGLFLDGLGSTTNGSPLGQWSSSTSNNQQWLVQAQ